MIETDQRLAALLPRLRAADWIAVDTEADSLHAYPEKLCLIQLSFAGADELLDPLAELDLTPVWAELRRHELILHGADYDLRLLQRYCAFVPTAIFDTMIASRLLGCRQFGLDSLVSKYLGVTLEKGPQKANWAQRPLTPRMMAYARNDTHYLKPLVEILTQQLVDTGRLAWHRESCARLIADSTQPRTVDPDLQWRVKGSSTLSPAALAVLREIWRWREAEAVAANKPPFFVMQPETMVHLADAAVKNGHVDDLLPRHLSYRRREGVLHAVRCGLAVDKHPPLIRTRGRRLTEAAKRRLHELERRRNRHATELGVDPSLIASRSTLVLLAHNWDEHQQEIMAWQRELLQS